MLCTGRDRKRGQGLEEQVVFLQELLEIDQQQHIELTDERHTPHRHDGIAVRGGDSANGGGCRSRMVCASIRRRPGVGIQGCVRRGIDPHGCA